MLVLHAFQAFQAFHAIQGLQAFHAFWGCHAGSGKTRVAVEVATFMLQHNPNAKIVFLANTVALAQQQAGTLLHVLLSHDVCQLYRCCYELRL